MTRENAKDYLPFVQALAEGKTIQYRRESGDWIDKENIQFAGPPSDYRVKPEKKWRAWSGSDIPLNAVFRWKNCHSQIHSLVAVDRQNGVIALGSFMGDVDIYDTTEQLEKLEHSTDGGRTWLPCGIETAE